MLSLIQRRNIKGGNYVTLIIPSACHSPYLADYFTVFVDFFIEASMHSFIDIEHFCPVFYRLFHRRFRVLRTFAAKQK